MTTNPQSPSLLDALLRLEQHAEGRRVARKDLIDATDRLAGHLINQLRVGDRIAIHNRSGSKADPDVFSVAGDRTIVEVVRVTWLVSQQWDGDQNPRRVPARDAAAALLFDGCVLIPPVAKSWDDGIIGSALHHVCDRPYYETVDGAAVEPARVVTREWFARHAAAIVAAFADRLKADREAMTTAAEQARSQRV